MHVKLQKNGRRETCHIASNMFLHRMGIQSLNKIFTITIRRQNLDYDRIII